MPNMHDWLSQFEERREASATVPFPALSLSSGLPTLEGQLSFELKHDA
jgi:hypothetical protein